MFSKGHRGLESIREDDKATKKSVAFRQSGQAQISGYAQGNQDIKAELSSIASSTSDQLSEKRDEFIKKGLTYRDAAHHIMNSLNEVSKRLGINPLIEPVLENATKAVQ